MNEDLKEIEKTIGTLLEVEDIKEYEKNRKIDRRRGGMEKKTGEIVQKDWRDFVVAL